MSSAWATLQKLAKPAEWPYHLREEGMMGLQLSILVNRSTYKAYDIAYTLLTKPEFDAALRKLSSIRNGEEYWRRTFFPFLIEFSKVKNFKSKVNDATREVMNSRSYKQFVSETKKKLTMKSCRKSPRKSTKKTTVRRKCLRRRSLK